MNFFSLFAPFNEKLSVGIFGKHDPCDSDEACVKALGLEHVAKLTQVHGAITHVVAAPTGFETKGDGIITKTPELALSVRWADCQAFAIYAPKENVVGVLHAGWRGMAARAITAFFTKLGSAFDVDPTTTLVGITPSLCKECTDFSDPLNELPTHLHEFVDTATNTVDLQAAADSELDSLNIPQNQRERIPICTKCGDGFWSWRGDRKEDARNFLIVGFV